MLDMKFIRENPEIVKKNIERRGKDPVLVDNLIILDKELRELTKTIDELRAKKNTPKGKPTAEEMEQLLQVKEEVDNLEKYRSEVGNNFKTLILSIPNLIAADVPDGKDDGENKEILKNGEIPKYDFEVRDHVQIGEDLDLLDFDRGSKVAQSGFYYLKNQLVLLDLALQKFAMDKLSGKGYMPIVTPDMAKDSICAGTGYNPRGEEKQMFNIADEEMSLIGTAEVTLGGFHADEILTENDLPKKYVGLSHCFRVEKGGYGKYSKGLYRVRQFTKVEMFILCKPEDSEKYHQELLANEQEIWNELGIPYRVVMQCTGDMSSASMKTYDVEAWMPGRGDYGEVTSTSNTGDYQSRRLKIRYNDGKSGDNIFVHMLNGTAVNNSRFPLTILENGQQADGSIKIPEVLWKYTGFKEIKKQ
jgi:seryl-tRNA synthetase